MRYEANIRLYSDTSNDFVDTALWHIPAKGEILCLRIDVVAEHMETLCDKEMDYFEDGPYLMGKVTAVQTITNPEKVWLMLDVSLTFVRRDTLDGVVANVREFYGGRLMGLPDGVLRALGIQKPAGVKLESVRKIAEGLE